MAKLTDLSELNQNTPARQPVNPDSPAEKEHMHRHAEDEAMKAARRAGEREKKDETGPFSNIGPA